MSDLIERLRQNALDECDEAIDRIKALEADNTRLRDALAWYRGNVSWCNSFSREGTEARDMLAKDGGKRAEEAISALESVARDCEAAR